MSSPDADSSEVLLVEDKESLRKMLRLALEQHGYRVREAADQPEAERALQSASPHVVITDLKLPDGDGFGVLRAAKSGNPDLPVIVMTAFGGIEDAVRAMREGAFDFVAKPVNPDHLLLQVGRALQQRRLADGSLLIGDELARRRGAPLIVGEDESLRKVLASVKRAAETDTTVLIEGESGTGKELVARAVHALSPRSQGPFVAINCAAIPETLLESELFGYEKGAFTGAVARKLGKFEGAHHGTLFLDEVGDLSLNLQGKVLRALEEKRFERVGSNTPVQVDVRLVAATNKNLRTAVVGKRFREDLYFRLSVFPITVPPLRERRSDIALLARHFVERFCREQSKSAVLSEAALEALQAYAWPGNVRELQNCLERAVILAGDTIRPGHLQLAEPVQAFSTEGALGGPSDPWTLIDLSGTLAEASRRVLVEVERRKIALALAETGGDRRAAAERLQVPVRFLLAKIRQFRLE